MILYSLAQYFFLDQLLASVWAKDEVDDSKSLLRNISLLICLEIEKHFYSDFNDLHKFLCECQRWCQTNES